MVVDTDFDWQVVERIYLGFDGLLSAAHGNTIQTILFSCKSSKTDSLLDSIDFNRISSRLGMFQVLTI